MNDSTNAMNRLRQLAPRMIELDGEMQSAVERVERFLVGECKIELPASALVVRDPADATEVLFSYDRLNDAFKLLVVTRKPRRDHRNQPILEPDGTPSIGETEIRAWKDCEKPLRTMTFAKLPELLAQIAKNVEQSIEISERASAAGKELLAGLGGN